MANTKDAGDEDGPSMIRITVVVANRYAFDTEVVTGKQTKERPPSRPASLSTAACAEGTGRSATTSRYNCTTAITRSRGHPRTSHDRGGLRRSVGAT